MILQGFALPFPYPSLFQKLPRSSFQTLPLSLFLSVSLSVIIITIFSLARFVPNLYLCLRTKQIMTHWKWSGKSIQDLIVYILNNAGYLLLLFPESRDIANNYRLRWYDVYAQTPCGPCGPWAGFLRFGHLRRCLSVSSRATDSGPVRHLLGCT